jgi:hypothetical protein
VGALHGANNSQERAMAIDNASTARDGTQGNNARSNTVGGSTTPVRSLSADGRFVVFQSQATNLVAGSDANGTTADILRKDLQTGAIVRINQTQAGVQANARIAVEQQGNAASMTGLDSARTGRC